MSDMLPENKEPTPGMPQEEGLGVFEKMVGIFTEPQVVFEKLSKHPPKVIDWALPVFIMLFFTAASIIITMQDPVIKQQVIAQRIAETEKDLDRKVDNGEITYEEREERLVELEKGIQMLDNPAIIALEIVFIFVGGFIVFFIGSGIYYLVARFAFGDQGTYQAMLVANGMAAYIRIVQTIIALIASLLTSTMIGDTSFGSFIPIETSSFVGHIASAIDPISFWLFIVSAIGMGKMFKSENPKRYFALVFGFGVLWTALEYFIESAKMM